MNELNFEDNLITIEVDQERLDDLSDALARLYEDNNDVWNHITDDIYDMYVHGD